MCANLSSWEQSKRLITGALVAMSPFNDAFQTTCVLATVAAQPLTALQQNSQEINLFFPHYHRPIDPMQKWIMVECHSSFFEASRRLVPRVPCGKLRLLYKVCLLLWNWAKIALFRAKRGIFLFGNAELLACRSRVWGEVVNIMAETKVPRSRSESCQDRRIGYCLPLQCANHQRKVWMEYIDDWDAIHGGCNDKCKAAFSCGHLCPYRCHL